MRRRLAFCLLALSLPAAAAPFCAQTEEGSRCIYQRFNACQEAVEKAAGKQGRCVTNQAELKKPVGKERYCVVTDSANQCFYQDAKSCQHAASASGGSCTFRAR
jgi:hypothetical protein